MCCDARVRTSPLRPLRALAALLLANKLGLRWDPADKPSLDPDELVLVLSAPPAAVHDVEHKFNTTR